MFTGHPKMSSINIITDNSEKLNLKTHYSVLFTIPIFFTLGFCLPHHNDISTQNGIFLGYDIAFIAAGFMLIGSYMKPLIKKLVEIKNIYLIFLMVVSGLLFLLGFSLTDYTYEFVLMANAVYPNIPAFLFCSLTGSLSIISAGILIYKFPIKKRILNFLGQNTLAIFLLHRHIKTPKRHKKRVLCLHKRGKKHRLNARQTRCCSMATRTNAAVFGHPNFSRRYLV